MSIHAIRHGETQDGIYCHYEIVEPKLLGEGTYGKVYKARHKRSGRIVAVKKMVMDRDDEGFPSTFLREIALLKAVSHRHIVELLDIYVSRAKIELVFEFVECDLKKFMRNHGERLGAKLVRKLALQLCLGVECCHSNYIVHRDLKPQNLLIDHRQQLKVADFGLARDYHPVVKKYTQDVVTVWYRAPEILLGSAVYSAPIDLWSVGCIIAEMATSAPLFAGDSEIDTIFKIFRLLGNPTEQSLPGVSSLPNFRISFPSWPARRWVTNLASPLETLDAQGVELVEQFLDYNPRKRIPAHQAIRHSFFFESKVSPPAETAKDCACVSALGIATSPVSEKTQDYADGATTPGLDSTPENANGKSPDTVETPEKNSADNFGIPPTIAVSIDAPADTPADAERPDSAAAEVETSTEAPQKNAAETSVAPCVAQSNADATAGTADVATESVVGTGGEATTTVSSSEPPATLFAVAQAVEAAGVSLATEVAVIARPDQPLQGQLPNERRRLRSKTPSDPSAPYLSRTSWAPVDRSPESMKTGDSVRVVGLHKRPELNGQEGTIMQWDEADHRWGVRLADGSIFRMTPLNLEAISQPSRQERGSTFLKRRKTNPESSSQEKQAGEALAAWVSSALES